MGLGSGAGRCHGDLARIGFGVSDEFGDRLGRNRWVYHHDEGGADHPRDRREIADEVVAELVIERRIDRGRRSDLEKCVAIGRRTHDRLGSDFAAATRPVLDDEWLAEPLSEPLAHQARDDVTWAAGSKADDDAHRPRRIGLRPSEARGGRQRGSARGQMQEFAAGKFHFEPPSRFTSLDHLVGAAGYLYVFAPPGRRTVKTEPWPGSLVT